MSFTSELQNFSFKSENIEYGEKVRCMNFVVQIWLIDWFIVTLLWNWLVKFLGYNFTFYSNIRIFVRNFLFFWFQTQKLLTITITYSILINIDKSIGIHSTFGIEKKLRD